MINPFTEINWSPNNSDLKSYGKVMIIGFTVLASIAGILALLEVSDKFTPTLAYILFAFGVLVFIMTRIIPKSVLPIYYVWFAVSASIGIVVSNLLLAIFFYGIFSIFAIGMRIFTKRDPLQLKKVSKDSYWISIDKEKELKRYLKQY